MAAAWEKYVAMCVGPLSVSHNLVTACSWIKGASTSPPINVHNPETLRRDIIASNGIASSWISSASESNVMPFTVWRYIGTTSGVWRVFPGHTSSLQYNPTIRYSRSCAGAGLVLMLLAN